MTDRERVESRDLAAVGYVIGAVGPIVVAGLLVPLRDDVIHANLALVLVVVVVLAALAGGRGPAVLAAVVSALSYDFFFTRPYRSLTIASANDVETVVLLTVIGLLVGELVVRARRSRRAAERGASEIARIHRIAELVATGADPENLETAVEAELTELLDLLECRLERPPFGVPLPRLERSGAITGVRSHRFVGGELALPEEGVELPVLGRGRQVGRLVLVPSAAAGASLEERVVAVALSDQLGAALATGTDESAAPQ